MCIRDRGITALFLLLFLFPNGRFYPAWLGAPALVGLALVLGGVVFIRFVENAWLVFVLILLALLLLGMVGQLLRYRACLLYTSSVRRCSMASSRRCWALFSSC